MPVSLIAIDVDGTLLTSDGRITDGTAAAIREAAEAGVHPVLCTGRARDECKELLARLPELRYMINCSGASVYDTATETELFVEGLPMETVRDLHRRIGDLECLFELMADGHIYTDRDRLSRLSQYRNPYYIDIISSTRIPCDMAEMLQTRTAPVAKVHLFFRCPEEREAAAQLLEPAGIPLLSSVPENLELNLPTVDKGLGLRRLAAHLRLSTADCMAIGDNTNDLGMLREAGFPVAMANACPEAMASAKYRTASCDEDGVALAIRRLLDGTLDTLNKEDTP